MVAYFQLQPAEAELQQLAEQYWQTTGEKEHELEKAAFEAGEAIRNGETTLANLEAIVRWKSERAVQYLIGNSNEKIRRVLATAASPEATTETAVKALIELHGVDLPVASAILAAIYPSATRCWITARWKRWGMLATTCTFTRSIWPFASAWPKATS